MKDKLYLIGPMDMGNVPTNGVTMKNQLFYKRFSEIFPVVKYIDTWQIGRKPWKILEILFALIFFRNYRFIISGGHASRKIINFVHFLPIKRNVVFWVAGGNLPLKVRDGLYNIDALNDLNAVIVQGISMRDELINLGVKNAVYVPNSKPITFIPELNIKQPFGKLRFVFLSRVHPDKGCDNIFEAVRYLNSKGYENRFEVDFYGSIFESYYSSFNSQISELPNVNYSGFLNVTKEDGYKILSSYDVMLFPTYWSGEGFPGVVVDAYIAGLPIIASDWNLNKEVIKNGETGFIIRTKNVQQLYNQMLKFINNEVDLAEMRKYCVSAAQNFEYRKVLSEKLMNEIGFN